MGGTCCAGHQVWPTCTLPYAPPEVAHAAWASERVTVHPSHDIWALGVIAYEAITRSRALTSQAQIAQCACHLAPYPWEHPPAQQPATWQQSRLQTVLAPCLARDPAARPSAAELCAAFGQLGLRSAGV